MKLQCAQHQYSSLKFQELGPVQSMKRLVTIEGCILFSLALEAFWVSSFGTDKLVPAVDGQYNQTFCP
jgi:hypothetical protein